MTKGLVGSPSMRTEQLGRVEVRTRSKRTLDIFTTKPQTLQYLLDTAKQTLKNIALVPEAGNDLFVARPGEKLRALRQHETNIIISLFERKIARRTDRVRIYTPAKNKGGRKHFATVRVR